MSSTTSPVFTGVSSYANDLQAVLTRAVAIASLPLTQLQNQLQDMNGKSTALDDLNTAFTALQSSVTGFDSAVGAQSLAATSSNPSAATATAAAGALPGEYTINVTSIGSATATISNASLPAVADPYSTSISSSTSFTLSVNGNSFTLKPASNSLMSLAQAINSSSAGVRASVVNAGSTSAPQYRLLIRSSNMGADTLQLNDGTQDLLDTLNTGSPVQYSIGGVDTPIQSNSRSITLAPGLTVNLLQTTSADAPVTISVTRNLDAAKSALSSFVTSYNSAVGALDKQVGANAGQLSGQSVVRTLYGSLSQITQYQATSGNVTTLADIGLTLGNDGKLIFDQSTFDQANVDDVNAFLGTTSGGGFLKAASDALNGAEDPGSGTLPNAIQQVKDEITNQNNLIATNQQRIDDLQTDLQQRLSAADAMLASLENQKSFLNNLFTAMINNNNATTGVKSS